MPKSDFHPMISRVLGFIVLVCSCITLSRAHEVDTVEFEFLQDRETWRLEGLIDISYMLPETRNVPDAPPLSRTRVMQAPADELERIRRETETTLRSVLRLSFNGETLPWTISFPDLEKTPIDLPKELSDWALMNVFIETPAKSSTGELKIHWSKEEQAELILLIEQSDEPLIESIPPGGEMVLLKITDTGVSEKTEGSRTGGWIGMGFRHVLPLGLDHLLFILGLFLLCPTWKPLVTQSLLFTLAHSMTLGLASLGWIVPPSKPVEILIAATIAFVGIENLFTRKLGARRVTMVGLFGLIHGFGFAGVLAGHLEGFPRHALVGPLLGFNVGVELAQLCVLAAAMLVYQILTKLLPGPRTEPIIRIGGSCLIALAGIGWMIDRTLG